MISCREVFDFLIDYVSDELPQQTRAEFERHLAVCPPCVAYLNSYRDTIRLARTAGRETDAAVREMPEELVRAVMSTLRGECSSGTKQPDNKDR